MPKNQRRKVKQHQETKANDGGHLEKQNMHEIEGEAFSRGKPRANAWFIKESKEMQSDNSVTIQKKEEIRLRKLEQERIQANLFKAVVDLKQEVNNPGEQNPETHLFVTPPNILKQQLTGYCTSPASSPMGRDNKHGWYEEHEKFVAIATRSLSSVLLVGDSLVNGLARYHRVWSKYLEPLRALNFGVGGDRTQHVLWRIENGEIPLNLQVAFIHCGTNNLDRDNPAEIRDGIASIVYTIQEKKPNANFIVSGLLPRDQEFSSRRDKIKLVNQKLMKWCRSGKVRNVHYLNPDKDWTEPDGRLVERYYFTDFLHLVEEGYNKFAKSIYEAIVKVSQGNVVDLVEDRKRSRNKSGSTTPPPKTQQTEWTNNINDIYNNSTTKTQTNCDITTPNCHRTKTENTTHSYLNTSTHNTTHHNLTTDNDNTTHSNLATNTDNITHSYLNTNSDNTTHSYLNTNSDNTTHSNITAHTDHDINLTTQSFDYNVTTHDNNTTFTETNNNTGTQTPTQM